MEERDEARMSKRNKDNAKTDHAHIAKIPHQFGRHCHSDMRPHVAAWSASNPPGPTPSEEHFAKRELKGDKAQ